MSLETCLLLFFVFMYALTLGYKNVWTVKRLTMLLRERKKERKKERKRTLTKREGINAWECFVFWQGIININCSQFPIFTIIYLKSACSFQPPSLIGSEQLTKNGKSPPSLPFCNSLFIVTFSSFQIFSQLLLSLCKVLVTDFSSRIKR